MTDCSSGSPTLSSSRDMSVKSSPSTDGFHLHSNLSSINPFHLSAMDCMNSAPTHLIYFSFFMIHSLFLLPLCVFIGYLGLQTCWQQHSTSRATAKSHSDVITYHMATMEVFGGLGGTLCCCGIFLDHDNTSLVGYLLYAIASYGETYFHVLTCLERYLAVVHPIVYLSLRGERGIRIRNIIIGCVWLLSCADTCLMFVESIFWILDFCLLSSALIFIIFCSLSVLFALIRPGPGEQGGDRERVHQSKQRAFYTIMAILGVLFFRCFWNLVWVGYHIAAQMDCVLIASAIWFNLPCSLVLPLLFLHRAGRFVCCKKDVK